MLGLLWSVLWTIISFLFSLKIFLIAPVGYLLTNFIPLLMGTQDLKKKYNASWALVTGGSSGIGKEITRSLLKQGLNVVIVARDEPVFDTTLKELKGEFKSQQVKKVCANLGDGTGAWMADVKKETDDLDIQIFFFNAGYVVTGFFEKQSAETHLANFNCNLTANVHLTHHFYSKMINKNQKGCIVYTSSSSGFMPNPFVVMYGCTKAGVSEFAASLAVEGKSRGIDVHSVHPSPVNSRFLAGGGNDVKVAEMSMITNAYKMAVGPETLPDKIFSAIGRSAVMVDLGGTTIGIRVLVHVLGFNLLNYVFMSVGHLLPDFQAGLKMPGQSPATVPTNSKDK